MIYLVTGGAGFIGSHIVRRLTEDGGFVRVLDDFSTGSAQNLDGVRGIEVVRRDLVFAPLDDVMRDVDVVFHLAAVPSVPLSVREPLRSHHAAATATLRLLIAARDAGVRRVVSSSSSSVYGDVAKPPMRESMPALPRSPYAVAKLAAEGYTRLFAGLFGIETVSLRYFNVFGPRQNPDSPYAAAIPTFIAAYLRRERPHVFGDGRSSRDFTFVEDAVEANILSAKARRLAGESVNIAAGHPHTVLELLDALAALFAYRLDPVFEPPRPGDIIHSHADISLARELLGYVPRVPFLEGLRRTVERMREQCSGATR